MVVEITSTKSSSSSTEAAEAYKKKQQQKLITPATVASLITCCAGQEVMGGFPNDGGIMNDDNDNDSFVDPTMQGSDSFAASSHSSAKKKPPMIMKTPMKNDSFGSAVKKQQQRNRFTSSPLIERDSSLVRSQSGLLSLLSSGTFVETSTSPRRDAASNNDYAHMTNNTTRNPISMKRNQTPPHPSMVTSHHTPPRSAGRRKQQHSPTRLNSNQHPTTSASPAMELSMARQSANATLSSTQYQRSRSWPKQDNTTLMAPTNSPIRSKVADTVAAMTIESPTKKARQEEEEEEENGSAFPAMLQQPDFNIEESYSAAETLPPSTPQQQQQKATVVQQTSSFSSTEIMASSSEHKKNIAIWQHYTKAALNDTKSENHLHHSNSSLLWDNNNDKGINEELNMSYKFPRMYLQDPTLLNIETLKQGAWWYRLQGGVESTMGHVRGESVRYYHLHHGENQSSNSQQQQQQQQQRGSDVSVGSTSTKSVKKTLSFGGSPKSKDRKSDNGNGSGGGNGGEFSPAVQPTNVWSEPHASTMKVRGPTYTKDNIKISSGESMFAVLGVDNFVKKEETKERRKSGGGGGGDAYTSLEGEEEEENVRSGTGSFRERWKSVCEEVGLESVPFLLVFNFIVPWGNFQMYLIRPDADNGPFSTHHADRPSEKAWKSFLEGDTAYRNTVLKFIPRIIAGPWMVKKMVGTTPAIIGQKLPVSYSGSIEENYLEVSLDVTQGPALGNTIANTVAGKADVVTVDLGFVLEGNEGDGTLPEQMLGLVRLHHFNMKKALTHAEWEDTLSLRSQS